MLSRRALSARLNGRLGGLSTAAKSSTDFLKQRASKAGSATRDKYGVGYYKFLRSKSSGCSKSNHIGSTVNKIKESVKELSSVQMIQQAAEQVGLSQ